MVGDGIRTAYMHPFSETKEATEARVVAERVLASVSHRFTIMDADVDSLDTQHGTKLPFYVKTGNDHLDGGTGNDLLVGDNLMLVSPGISVSSFHASYRNRMEEIILDYLWDIAEIATDVDHAMFQAHHNLLLDMKTRTWDKSMLRVSVPSHGIDTNNDVLHHGSGNGNYMVGDTATVVFDVINVTLPFALEAVGSSCPDGPWMLTHTEPVQLCWSSLNTSVLGESRTEIGYTDNYRQQQVDPIPANLTCTDTSSATDPLKTKVRCEANGATSVHKGTDEDQVLTDCAQMCQVNKARPAAKPASRSVPASTLNAIGPSRVMLSLL